jgi:hypothetical protein
MELRVDEILSQSSRPASRKGSASSTGRGRGRPRKSNGEDNSHSAADEEADAAVYLGKRSRAAATAVGDALSNSAFRKNKADTSQSLTARSHLDKAAASDAPVAALVPIQMEEISMFSAVDFTWLVKYLELQAPASSGGKFVAHSRWEQLHIDSKGVAVAEAPAYHSAMAQASERALPDKSIA